MKYHLSLSLCPGDRFHFKESYVFRINQQFIQIRLCDLRLKYSFLSLLIAPPLCLTYSSYSLFRVFPNLPTNPPCLFTISCCISLLSNFLLSPVVFPLLSLFPLVSLLLSTSLPCLFLPLSSLPFSLSAFPTLAFFPCLFLIFPLLLSILSPPPPVASLFAFCFCF